MVMVTVLRHRRGGVSNLAESVNFIALSEIVPVVLLAMEGISNVFTFSSCLIMFGLFSVWYTFLVFYWDCARIYVYKGVSKCSQTELLD